MNTEGKQQREKMMAAQQSLKDKCKNLKMEFHCLENPVLLLLENKRMLCMTCRGYGHDSGYKQDQENTKSWFTGKTSPYSGAINQYPPPIHRHLKPPLCQPRLPSSPPRHPDIPEPFITSVLFIQNFQFPSLCFPGSTKAEIPSFKNMMWHQKMMKVGQ